MTCNAKKKGKKVTEERTVLCTTCRHDFFCTKDRQRKYKCRSYCAMNDSDRCKNRYNNQN